MLTFVALVGWCAAVAGWWIAISASGRADRLNARVFHLEMKLQELGHESYARKLKDRIEGRG